MTIDECFALGCEPSVSGECGLISGTVRVVPMQSRHAHNHLRILAALDEDLTARGVYEGATITITKVY